MTFLEESKLDFEQQFEDQKYELKSMRLRVNELMSKGGGAKKVNIRKWFSNTNCTIMYATVRCTLICTLYGLKRHLSFLCLVHTVYDALLNYAFPFLISFFHQIFRKIFIFVKAFAPMAQQSHFFYWEIHFLAAKAHTNYQHNRLTNWQDLHNYSENDSWLDLFTLEMTFWPHLT